MSRPATVRRCQLLPRLSVKLLVLYTTAPEAQSERVPIEFSVTAAAECVASSIPGSAIQGIAGEMREVVAAIERHQPDLIFNCCEAPLGRPDREPHVAALFEWLGVPFTGSGSECLALCRRKDRVNALLAAAGIAVPRRGGGFPCIVKPADEDGSYGIWTGSICENNTEVERARSYLNGRVLVEEFLPGREFPVSLWGATTPEYLSLAETQFQGGMRLRTYFAKWHGGFEHRNTLVVYESVIEPSLRKAIGDIARAAWETVEARGYLRVDIRLDADGGPCVLDVNPNPEIAPGCGLHQAVVEAGWEWPRFIQKQIEWAL